MILNRGPDGLDAGAGIRPNVEIPESQHQIPDLMKSSGLLTVSHLRPVDLLVPVGSQLPNCEVVRVTVPERAIHKHGYSPSREGDIGLAGKRPKMAPVSFDTTRCQCTTQRVLRTGVPTSDRGHVPRSARSRRLSAAS